MNWNLVLWVAGTMATIYMIKFVLMLMRNVFSKQNARRVVEGIDASCNRASDRCKNYIMDRMEDRRTRKEVRKEMEEKPTPTIMIR